MRPVRPILTLLVVAFVLRLGWGLMQPADPDARLGDQFEYLQLGRNLLAAGELKFTDARFDQAVYAYRTPGYPFLVAACGGNVRAIRIAQALIGTSTVLAVWLMARRWLGSAGARLASVFVAFNPFLIYFSGLILSETLFVAMLAWGMCLLARDRQGAGTLLVALSVLVRPSAMGLAVFLAAGAAWTSPRPTGGPAKRGIAALRNALIAAALIVAVLFPWAWRNAHHPRVRAWIWTTTNEGVTAYDGFHDGATGASDQKAFLDRLAAVLWRMDEVERNAYLSQQAHEWIRAHPDRAVGLTANKIARTWSPVPLSSEYGASRLHFYVGLLFALPFDLLALFGLCQGALPRSTKVFLLIPAIYFTAIHALSVGSLRYRLPAEPPMSVIVGCGAAALLNRYGPSRRHT
jgi:4-amino-4-deoxy-L-arabinose transferase-like glycosyltransferase